MATQGSHVQPGETVLLREGAVCRWVRIVLVAPLRDDGTQAVSVINLEPYGRSTPRRVTLGVSAFIEWIS